MRRLNVFEIKCQRPMVVVTRWDKVRNDERRAVIKEILAGRRKEKC